MFLVAVSGARCRCCDPVETHCCNDSCQDAAPKEMLPHGLDLLETDMIAGASR